MKIFWRIVLIIVAVISFSVIALIVAAFYSFSKPAEIVNKDLTFYNKLIIPPLLIPKEENGEKIFDLTIQKGESEIFKDKKTETWGYNGNILGPTIRARTGDKVRMKVTNKLGKCHGQELY